MYKCTYRGINSTIPVGIHTEFTNTYAAKQKG